MPWWVWLAVGVACPALASPQSNYDQQELSLEYTGSGQPEFATLNGTVVELGKARVKTECIVSIPLSHLHAPVP